MITERRSLCSSIARIFAARQRSCGRSTVVFTLPDRAGPRLVMSMRRHGLPSEHYTVSLNYWQYGNG